MVWWWVLTVGCVDRALANATTLGSYEQMRAMVQQGCLPIMCGALEGDFATRQLLDGIHNILQSADDEEYPASETAEHNEYAAMMIAAGLDEAVRACALDGNVEAQRIIMSFFDFERTFS